MESENYIEKNQYRAAFLIMHADSTGKIQFLGHKKIGGLVHFIFTPREACLQLLDQYETETLTPNFKAFAKAHSDFWAAVKIGRFEKEAVEKYEYR